MLDFVLIYQMFDDNKSRRSSQERQCISEKKKDRKTHYTESLILHITNQLKPEGGNSCVTAK
jgi:hypothetical protein